MILEMEPLDPFILGRIGRQEGFEPGIVVAERPDPLRALGDVLDLCQPFLDRPQFLHDGRLLVPPDPWVAGDRATVEQVAIGHDQHRAQLATQFQQRPVRRASDAGDVMRVGEDDRRAILDLDADAAFRDLDGRGLVGLTPGS